MKRWLISLATVAVAVNLAVAAALAHEGHAHKTMGTVTMIHENHVEVRDVKGVVTTHLLDARTRIKRGRAVLTLADIKVGERVVISTVESKDKAGKVVKTVTEVAVGAAAAPTTRK